MPEGADLQTPLCFVTGSEVADAMRWPSPGTCGQEQPQRGMDGAEGTEPVPITVRHQRREHVTRPAGILQLRVFNSGKSHSERCMSIVTNQSHAQG